jgi:phosphopentomutase
VPRAAIIVLDAVGVGELPDAADYGDAGSSTLQHVAEAVGGLDLPNLQRLGLGVVQELAGCPPEPEAPSVVGRLRARSAGKDTTTGHWELAGVVTEVAMPTYPEGFPAAVLDAFAAATGRGVIGNEAASGTEIIERLGDEHVATGSWIVYTSADSVFQVAAHEDVVPLEELYAACRTARELLRPPHAVGRVIARPFTGAPAATGGPRTATTSRSSRSAEPPLTAARGGVAVHGVGKIADVFAGLDVDTSAPTASNVEGIEQTVRLLRGLDDGLVFTNLVETDMVYGHRNDPAGSTEPPGVRRGAAGLLAALRDDDLLVLCSDHGCDPTTPSTDHSREHALLIAHRAGASGPVRRHDGWFSDVGATCYQHLTGRAPGSDLPGDPFAV